jgi:uncharacterized membrane protein (DUF485 family)
MLHKNAGNHGKDLSIEYKTRVGVWMFILYALVYSGFVAINVIKPVMMEMTVVFGLNLAAVYGFGLIIFALILALIYNSMCNKKEAELGFEKTDERSSVE